MTQISGQFDHIPACLREQLPTELLQVVPKDFKLLPVADMGEAAIWFQSARRLDQIAFDVRLRAWCGRSRMEISPQWDGYRLMSEMDDYRFLLLGAVLKTLIQQNAYMTYAKSKEDVTA